MSYQIYSNSAPTMGNITLGNTYKGAGLYQLTGGTGGTYAGAYTVNTVNTGTSNGIWTNGSSSNAIHIKGDAEFEGKVRINGQDLAKTLETIQARLCILIPDPKLLEKYEALKQAYDYYKTLEALCVEQNNTEKEQ